MATVNLAYDVTLPPGCSERKKNLPPIILLHGILDSRKTWNNLAPKIAERTGRKVYTLDARNHGETTWSDYFSFDILADDLDHFMEKAKISKAVLIGHSMGGRTALTLALRKPEKVEKLIVEDMTPRNFHPGQGSLMIQLVWLLRESLNAIPPGVDEQTARKAVADFMAELIPPEFASKPSKDVYDIYSLPIKKCADGSYAWQANLELIEIIFNHNYAFSQNLSGVYMGDSLFLYGTKSFFKIKNEPLIPKLFPKAQIVPIHGAAHLIHTARPNEFLNEVVFFINSSPKLKSKY